jgi:hypothetical protein
MPTHGDFLALAAASFATVLAALSVNVYDWTIITGVSVLCAAIPMLVSFARWIPPNLQPTSRWPDWIANHLWILAMPSALLGISFVFAHVHAVCGIVFGLSSFVAFTLYLRRLIQLGIVRGFGNSNPR